MNAVYGSVQGGWPEFFQPAFILWIIFLIPTAFGILYVADVKAGTLDRTLTAGVKYYHLLISILISEGVMTLVQLGLCFIVLLFGFNFQVVGSLSLTIFLCFLMGMIGVTLGKICLILHISNSCVVRKLLNSQDYLSELFATMRWKL